MATGPTRKQTDEALPKIADALRMYLDIQSRIKAAEYQVKDPWLRRRFNHFYRVRRSPVWQSAFFDLMARHARERMPFLAVLEVLREAGGKYEASYASKLCATVDPSMPVIDQHVLRNLGLRIPSTNGPGRAGRIAEVHSKLVQIMDEYLRTDNGEYLTTRFKTAYPDACVTPVKMVDLVLWQTRD